MQAALVLVEPVRKQAVASLRACAAENFDNELSELQATLLLDHVVSDIGPAIYNQVSGDARAYVEDRAADPEAALHKAECPRSGRRKAVPTSALLPITSIPVAGRRIALRALTIDGDAVIDWADADGRSIIELQRR